MRKHIATLGLLAFASTASTSALAQSITAAANPEDDAEVTTEERSVSPLALARVLGGGPASDTDRTVAAGYQELTPSAQISSEDGNFEADFALDYVIGAPPVTNSDGTITGGFSTLSVKVNVPLGEASSDTIDFGDFGRDGTLKFSFSHFMPSFVEGKVLKPYLQAMVVRCVALRGHDWVDNEGGSAAERDQFILNFVGRFPSGGTIRSGDSLLLDTASDLSNNSFSAVAQKECAAGQGGLIGNELDIVTYFEQKFPDDQTLRDYHNNITEGRTTFFIVEGGAGVNSFSIADETTFVVEEKDRLGFDVNANFGLVFNGGDTAIRGGVGYTRVFEAQDETEFCRMGAMMGETECINGQNGDPTRKNTGYFEVGLRHVIARRGNDGAPSVAIAPTLTYILEDKDFQFRLPLFLQQSKENGLDAGVQAIYNGADDDFGVGVFIGVPFGLINR